MVYEIYYLRAWLNKIDPNFVDSYWPNSKAHWAEQTLEDAIKKCEANARYAIADQGLTIIEFDGKTRCERYRFQARVVVELKVIE